jgi:hypothetical protein
MISKNAPDAFGSSHVEDQIAHVAASIRGRRDTLDAESKRLRTPAILKAFDKWNHNSWCLSVAGDCLVRLRLFTEQNFNHIETMGIIAVARYVFELSVWLHLFERDARYGLVYYSQLLEAQRRFCQDHHGQLLREIALLRQFEQRERGAQRDAARQIQRLADAEKRKEPLASALKAISTSIDDQAARHFSIYAEQAKTYGYGFQAHLVERRAVPQIEAALAAVATEKAALDARIPQDIKDMIPKRWEWRQMASIVGLADEYDFIYTFACKVLHATPISITTDEKNLEPSELVLFLRYINVKVIDTIGLAREYPKTTTHQGNPGDSLPASG